MARWQSVPVAGGAYSDDTKPWSVQDTVNRLPVPAERDGARSAAILRDCPGMSVFSVVSSGAAIRGLYNAEGVLLAVAGQTLYRIASDSTVTSLGTIPGVGRVSMAHNQITGGNQVVIANGQSGYVYDTKAGTLAQITDSGFPGAKVVGFVDGYIAFVEAAGRYWGHSDLADATSYNTLDRSEAESQPDRIVSLIVSHREVVLMGERTVEFFGNTGAATGTFQRKDGTEMEVGCAATFSVAKLDNAVFWLGNDGIVYRMNGYQPQRISTHAIEQAISRCDLASAYAVTFEDRGHKVYYLTFTDGQTWGYDVATGEWHRRKSYGLDFWRIAHLVYWNGAWIGADYSNGKLYQLDWSLSNDAGQPLERSRTFAVMHDNGNRVHVNAVRLFYDTGRDAQSPPLPTPLLDELAISGDLPDLGQPGDTESGSYAVTGGVQPVTLAVTSGAFPAGLTLATDGSWGGARTTEGTYSWTVTATDAEGTTASLNDLSTTRYAPRLLSAAVEYVGSYSALTVSGSDDFPATLPSNNTYDPVAATADGTVIAMKTASNTVAIYRYNSTTQVYDLQTITGSASFGVGSESRIAITEDGGWVLTMQTFNGEFKAFKYTGSGYTLQNSQSITPLDGSSRTGYGFCLSPDGGAVAFTSGGTLYRYTFNTATGVIASAASASMSVGSGAFSRMQWVGNYIAASSGTGGASELAVFNASTLVKAASVAGSVNNAHFNAATNRLYYAINTAGTTYEVRVASFDGNAVSTINAYPHTFGGTSFGCIVNADRTHLVIPTGVPYTINADDTLTALTALTSFDSNSAVWTSIA